MGATKATARPRPRSTTGARGDDRRAREQRRSRMILVASVLAAGFILVGWFPAGALLNQHRALGEVTAHLNDLKAQDRELASERSKLSSPAEITKLAREQYQLVQPGQRLVQVLPPPGAATPEGVGQSPYPGDPGLTKPVRPSAVALLPTGSTTTTTQVRAQARGAESGPEAPVTQPGLFDRVLHTIEFWRR
ncbi:MAG: septum formation initiator family protein [Actinomycetes bacterium]